MAIDVSHCGERTSRDAIAASRQPVLVTHSQLPGLVPGTAALQVRRGDPRRWRRSGGVMGITAVRAFVGGAAGRPRATCSTTSTTWRGWSASSTSGSAATSTSPRATPRPAACSPFYAIGGLDPRARVFQFADGLLRRGWSGPDVELMLGGNFRRVLAEIWRDRGRRPPPGATPSVPPPAARAPGPGGGWGAAQTAPPPALWGVLLFPP